MKTCFDDNTPKFIRTDHGSFTGLCVELMELVSEGTSIEFDYPKEFIPKKRYQNYLNTGQIDVFFGLKKTKAREKIYKFGEPLYEVKYIALVRKDDPVKIQSVSDIIGLKDNTVLSVFGSAAIRYLKGLDLNVDDGGKDVNANIRKLIAKRGRFFIYHNLGIFYVLNHSEYKNKLRVIDLGLKKYFHYVLFSKNADPKLVKAVNASIVKLKKEGKWQHVVSKYFEY